MSIFNIHMLLKSTVKKDTGTVIRNCSAVHLLGAHAVITTNTVCYIL